MWLFSLAIPALSLGCVQHIRLYSGPKLPDSKVARLTGSHFQLYHMTTLYVDGRQLVPDPKGGWVGSAKVLPGPHRVEWSYKDPTATFTSHGGGVLDAKAGKTYCFCFAYLPKNRTAAGLNTYRVEVGDHATWIEEQKLWGERKVVVGTKPQWAK